MFGLRQHAQELDEEVLFKHFLRLHQGMEFKFVLERQSPGYLVACSSGLPASMGP